MRLNVQELTADGVAQQLSDGRIDMGVSYRPADEKDLVFEPLYDEQMVLVVARGHRLAHRKRIRMAEMHELPVVLPPTSFMTRQILDRCFSAAGATPAVVAQMDTISPMLAYVRRSDVATVTSGMVIAGDIALVAIPLEAPTPMRTPGILWRTGSAPTPAMRSLASTIRQIAERHLRETKGRAPR